MDAQEAAGQMANGFAILVDVREPEEIKESGKAKGALAFPSTLADPKSAEWAAFKAKLPKNKTIITYCKAGGRAGRVADALRQEGYQVGNMGGFDGWVSAGLPVDK